MLNVEQLIEVVKKMLDWNAYDVAKNGAVTLLVMSPFFASSGTLWDGVISRGLACSVKRCGHE